jgi:hypothetical protein
MDMDNAWVSNAAERVPALLLAAAATLLIFAGINAGFAPHGADLAGLLAARPALAL